MKIRLGPHVYRVVRDKTAIDLKATEHNERRLYGLCEPTAGLVHIDPTLTDSQQRETVLHELLHACFSVAGMDELMSGTKEERVVRQVAPWLLLLLQSNPKLVRYLTETP